MDMIQNIFFILLTILVSVGATPLVFAQSDATSTVATTSTRSETEVTKERGLRKVLTSAKQTRIANLSANISNKLEATIARLETITIRIERRISKMEMEGYDVKEVKEKVSQAKVQLETASTLLKNIDTSVGEVTGSEKPNDVWKKVRETFISAHKALMTAKQNLRECVTLLRQSQPKTTETEKLSPSETAEGNQN